MTLPIKPPQLQSTFGASIAQTQFENGNSGSAFPFEDDFCPNAIVRETIVDACIVVPGVGAPSPAPVTLGCLHIGPSMVSAMVCIDGKPALYCNALKEGFVPFSPIRMTPVDPSSGVSGVMAFGDPQFGRPVTVRDDIPFSESAVVRPVVGGLRKFVQPSRGLETKGLVAIYLPDGVSMKITDKGQYSYVDFSVSQEIKDMVTVSCEGAENGPRAITSINGVAPDEDGCLAIVFGEEPAQ